MSLLKQNTTIQPRHIPPLFVATSLTIASIYPYFSPSTALRIFGFPQPIYSSAAAAPVFKVGSSRTSAIGLALFGMYFAGEYKGMDILLGSMGAMAVVDGLVLAQQGNNRTAVVRLLGTGAVAAWGLLGLTSREL